ncbi:ATP-binding protein [Streptosporangium sp. NPDC001559]|uniref:ATP-binding protein n=1 Tax=Streptosporangium sp. NPDC001559 TaxID=3366187 RepID=UPI0036E1C0F4
MNTTEFIGTLVLPGVKESVGLARQYATSRLMHAGYTQTDDAILLLSEVVTNAVMHTASGQPGGAINITIRVLARTTLYVEVIDDGSSSVPTPQMPDEMVAGGRGLQLVELLTDRWGVRQTKKNRTAVWMEISMPSKPDEEK